MLKAVTFDFWGTLVDVSHALTDERIAYLAACLPHSRRKVAEAYRDAWIEFMRQSAQGLGLGTSTVLANVLDNLSATLSPQQAAAVLRYWQEVLIEYPPPFLPCVSDVMQDLCQRGLRIALISDTGFTPGSVLRRVLGAEGIRHCFDWLTFSNEIGVTKRRPYAFTSTLRALGVSPSEALHVGDRLTTDMDGAKGVGMYTALITESSGGEANENVDFVLEHMADLPTMLVQQGLID